jgi:predicted Holliday junction resolvase-like endonuclease
MTLIIFIICVTIYALFGDYIKELTRKLELENDRREIENDERRYNQRNSDETGI